MSLNLPMYYSSVYHVYNALLLQYFFYNTIPQFVIKVQDHTGDIGLALNRSFNV